MIVPGIALLTAAAFASETNLVESPVDQNRWSVNLDAGIALPQSVNIQGADRMDFDKGIRFDAGVGYVLTKTLSVGVETGIIHNSVDKIGGVPVSTYGGNAEIFQVPLVADLIFTPPLKGILKPYIGAGVGGVATVANLDTPLGAVNDMDVTFCFQGIAGIKCAAGEHLEFGVAYKFLGTLDHSWSENGVTLNTDGILTHSIVAVITWKF
jgi:opacity protein-like surface antigen